MVEKMKHGRECVHSCERMRDKRKQVQDAGLVKMVLEKARIDSGEAFRLISSDDARKEGFFRNAGSLLEKFPNLEHVREMSQRAESGVYICKSEQNPTDEGSEAVFLYNDLMSIRAKIWFREREGQLAIAHPIVYPIDLQGMIHTGETVDRYELRLRPRDSRFGTYLEAEFEAKRILVEDLLRAIAISENPWPGYEGAHKGIVETIDVWTKQTGKSREEVIDLLAGMSHRYVEPFDYLGFGELLRDPIHFIGNHFISHVFETIVRKYPANDYQMAKTVLNLLAEFEAMLDSAIKHFEVKKNE